MDELHRRGVRVRFIGERERFGAGLVSRMQLAEQRTADNTTLTLSIAASYGVLVMGWKSRWPVRQLRFFNFGAQPSAPSRILKMLAGTLAIVRQSGRWSGRNDARGRHRRPAPAAAARHRSPATGPR